MVQGFIVSSRPPRAAVKRSARPKAGLARHLEGWQPAALAIFLAGSTALIAVPKSVEPVDLPEPRIDVRALERVARADEALAAGADRERLDVDVLDLGSAIFAYGEADAAGDALALGRERRRVLDTAQRAREAGAPALLALRAHHLRSFLQEIRRLQQTGEESVKLVQLAGGFTRMVQRNGWVTAEGKGAPTARSEMAGPNPSAPVVPAETVGPNPGAPLVRSEATGGESPNPGAVRARQRLLMDRAVLAAFFKKHWNEITGLTGELFALSLDESRVFYRFLLQHPVRGAEGLTSAFLPFRGPHAAKTAAEVERALSGTYRLKKIDELGAVDPGFPVHLARGVVLYQLQRYPLALEAFRRHLEEAPDGPYSLRAQNYLRAALARAREE